LRNARIVDGTGNPSYRGDVAVRGDTIAAIAPTIDGPAIRIINLGGQVLAPGFIDVHNHGRTRRGIFQHPTADNFVRQGVTTVIEGPDGSSPVPLAPFLKQLAALPKSLNIGAFIGQGSVRIAVMGRVNRPASADEIDKMRLIVEQGMRDGAYVDNYRTPHTTQLHVIERFQLAEGGKTLQVTIHAEDPGAFNMPWSARQTYHRTRAGAMEEAVCAENNIAFDASVSEIPKADRPDF
jgi:N-acyl-D-aspartate/D-glutamate deacylase